MEKEKTKNSAIWSSETSRKQKENQLELGGWAVTGSEGFESGSGQEGAPSPSLGDPETLPNF